VKGSGPADASTNANRANCCGNDTVRPPLHLRCGPPREGEQQDAGWVGAIDDQVRDAMRQGVGLARAGASEAAVRLCWRRCLTRPVLDGGPLRGIEGLQVGCVRHGGSFRT
jgi:hypothetical protein